MIILGVRCSNTDITFALLNGTRNQPEIQSIETLVLPRGFKDAEKLDWVYREASSKLSSHNVEFIVIKKFEGIKRDKAFSNRVGFEAAVILSAWHAGQIPILKKVKGTIAKDMGFKGRARYLLTHLDTTVIDGFDDFDDKSRDAVLAAWSELR